MVFHDVLDSIGVLEGVFMLSVLKVEAFVEEL